MAGDHIENAIGAVAANVDAKVRILVKGRVRTLSRLGEFHELGSSNPSVLAYLRSWTPGHGYGDGGGLSADDDVVICVNNLSRFPQPVELDLSAYRGCRPVELTGGVPFPLVGELPYLLTLPGHGFYWFQLRGESA